MRHKFDAHVEMSIVQTIESKQITVGVLTFIALYLLYVNNSYDRSTLLYKVKYIL